MIDQSKPLTQNIRLRQNAWYGDDLVELTFPRSWQVQLIQPKELSALNSDQLLTSLNNSIGSNSLSQLCKTSKKPILLIDDLTRPTPIAAVLPLVINELNHAGIDNSDIKVLIACGTHNGIRQEQINMKLEGVLPEEIQVFTHDCNDCELIGFTSTKTPIQTSRHVLESDLRIGIGGIYPHPIAGFSGGGKLLALGAGGYDTIRILHDTKNGSQDRDGNVDHEFRREVNEIVKKIGYDFSINLILNADRKIGALFCGDPEVAFHQGVEFYKQFYSIDPHEKADIVIADMYPFDTDFQYAFDRGLWPFETSQNKNMNIILAASPAGISGHILFPVKNPLLTRFLRRLRYFKFRDITELGKRINVLVKIKNRRKLDVIVVSGGINQQDLLRVLPSGIQVDSWSEMKGLFSQKFGSNSVRNVAIYKTSPLLMVRRKEKLIE